MLYFIFGDNIVESRKKLQEILGKHKEVSCIKTESCLSFLDFTLLVKGKALFSENQIYIFENFFKGKTEKWKNEIKYNELEQDDNIYVFWEDNSPNTAGKKASLFANKKNVFEFKIPNLLWNFLEEIKPEKQNTEQKILIQKLNKILKTSSEINYLFLMIIRQFRLLILSKEKYADYPSDFKKLTFQKYKLAKQCSYFTKEQLFKNYKKLLEIEERLKSGNSIYELTTEIEKFLLNL